MNEHTQRYDAVTASRKRIVINNFLGGISWALGTTVGFSLVVAIAGIILKQVGVVPFFGNLVIQISDFVGQNMSRAR
jgi:hypothetical protein